MRALLDVKGIVDYSEYLLAFVPKHFLYDDFTQELACQQHCILEKARCYFL
jgi:hypothetical protein